MSCEDVFARLQYSQLIGALEHGESKASIFLQEFRRLSCHASIEALCVQNVMIHCDARPIEGEATIEGAPKFGFNPAPGAVKLRACVS